MKDVLVPNATLYVATDEQNRTFFAALAERYRLYFLDDFGYVLNGLRPSMFGMADQLVISRGRMFTGTYYSTFTSYVNRIRGYRATKERWEGYESGRLPSIYYAPKTHRDLMQHYTGLWEPVWARDFPISWRGIDHDRDRDLSEHDTVSYRAVGGRGTRTDTAGPSGSSVL